MFILSFFKLKQSCRVLTRFLTRTRMFTFQVQKNTGRIAGSTLWMEHLATLSSWRFFLLLNQKSSIIFARVSQLYQLLSDSSAATLFACLLRRRLLHSDLPGVHSDESLSGGRLVAVSHQQLRDGDIHHRFDT